MKSVIQTLVGVVFLFSAVTKIADLISTSIFFSLLTGIDYVIMKYLVLILCFVEMIIGALFIFGAWRRKNIYLFISTLIGLFVGINIMMMIDGESNCGCFGTMLASSPLLSLIKNLVIFSIMETVRRKEDKLLLRKI